MTSNAHPIVFISHSHHDRDVALRLKQLLENNNAGTFLDQEQILAGDPLPKKISTGIEGCTKFLLLWSVHSAQSEWVEREWMTAFESKKRIIPYVLDSTELPDALENFVYVFKTDQEHGNAELFRAIFGKVLEDPVGVTVYPGSWKAELIPPDRSGEVVYRLELKSNGQITGESELKQTGPLGWAAGEAGRELGVNLGFMFQPTPMEGKWSYRSGMLSLDLVQFGHGQRLPFSIQVHTTDKRPNVLYGTGPAGTKVTLRRTE